VSEQVGGGWRAGACVGRGCRRGACGSDAGGPDRGRGGGSRGAATFDYADEGGLMDEAQRLHPFGTLGGCGAYCGKKFLSLS
jgi:hypothetical protein